MDTMNYYTSSLGLCTGHGVDLLSTSPRTPGPGVRMNVYAPPPSSP